MANGGDDSPLTLIADIEAAYEDVLDFVPPKVKKRIATSAEIDPETLRIVERWRLNALTPAAVGRETCRAEKRVAFSCKRRGFCPSCGARRITGTAALLAPVADVQLATAARTAQ